MALPGHRTRKVPTETNLLRNRRGEREERRSFLILCEGKTEKGYFSGLRSRRGPHLDLDAPKGGHLAVVREAVSRVSDEYDAVWCVLDTELDETLTTSMVSEARRGPVDLGLSTPCFEFWLILHHVEYARPFQSADHAKKRLRELVPTWNEGNTRFADFADGVEEACRRARKLSSDSGEPMKNPSTNLWQLLTSLVDWD